MFVPGRRTKMCFEVRFERGQSGCLTERQEGVCSRKKDQGRRDRGSLFQAEGPKTERQREFVPGRRTKDGETEGVCSRQKDQDGETEGVCSRKKDQDVF